MTKTSHPVSVPAQGWPEKDLERVAGAIVRVRELFQRAPHLQSQNQITGCGIVTFDDLKTLQEYADDVFERGDAHAERSTFGADEAWHELVEKDDRTSPEQDEDAPDMALITFDELKDFMARARSPAVVRGNGAVDPEESE